MAIIDNGVRNNCTNEPNRTSTWLQSPCPPSLENVVSGTYVHLAAGWSYLKHFIENGGVAFAAFFAILATPITLEI
jgi:hypothetical protein